MINKIFSFSLLSCKFCFACVNIGRSFECRLNYLLFKNIWNIIKTQATKTALKETISFLSRTQSAFYTNMCAKVEETPNVWITSYKIFMDYSIWKIVLKIIDLNTFLNKIIQLNSFKSNFIIANLAESYNLLLVKKITKQMLFKLQFMF